MTVSYIKENVITSVVAITMTLVPGSIHGGQSQKLNRIQNSTCRTWHLIIQLERRRAAGSAMPSSSYSPFAKSSPYILREIAC